MHRGRIEVTFGTQINSEYLDRNVARIDAIVRPIDRLKETVANSVGAYSLSAVVDCERSFEKVRKQRNLMEVPAGFAAGRDCDDGCGYRWRLVGIADLLSDDSLITGKDRGQ